MNELERHWELVRQTKLKQNARRAKAGRSPMWPELIKAEAKKAKASKAKKPPAPESGDEDDTALSFDEWKDSGWSVRKGEKAKIFSIEGIPQFTRDQVRKINPAWKFKKR